MEKQAKTKIAKVTPKNTPSKITKEPGDIVDEVGEDSFPASDPPSWTLGEKEHKDEKEHEE